MRRFTAEYLERTRRGMWRESRAALADLDLSNRRRLLDVGCGTGELSDVLRAETPADAAVVGVDADPNLLAVARAETGVPVLAGDATRLPVVDDAFDLVVCQALLVNLPTPLDAVREFARVSSDLVAAIEPNNARVGVESTVSAEASLDRDVRAAYLDGVGTDVALGDRVSDAFRDAGLDVVGTATYYHEKRVEPPYAESALRGAARKASGAGLADYETELRRTLSDDEYDDLRTAWRELGRSVVEQMNEGTYRRVEVVPFEVTVGRV
ncbi:class I SAM-dependent methyltransferase [Haloferacaceae archaeon DSL9]